MGIIVLSLNMLREKSKKWFRNTYNGVLKNLELCKTKFLQLPAGGPVMTPVGAAVGAAVAPPELTTAQ